MVENHLVVDDSDNNKTPRMNFMKRCTILLGLPPVDNSNDGRISEQTLQLFECFV